MKYLLTYRLWNSKNNQDEHLKTSPERLNFEGTVEREFGINLRINKNEILYKVC